MENVYILIFSLFLRLKPSFSWHETERNAPYMPIQKYKFEGVDITYAPEIYIKENQDCYSYFIDCILNREDLNRVCIIRPPNYQSDTTDDLDTINNHCEVDFMNCHERGKRSGPNYMNNWYVYNGDGPRCAWRVRSGRSLANNLRMLKEKYGYQLKPEDLQKIYTDEKGFISRIKQVAEPKTIEKVDNEPTKAKTTIYNSKTDPGFKRIRAIIDRITENKLTGNNEK